LLAPKEITSPTTERVAAPPVVYDAVPFITVVPLW